MRVLIIGCGYVGLPLGAELARQGHEVFGLRRSRSAEGEMRAAGLVPLAADIMRPEDLAPLAADYDWVVNCVASSGGDAMEYRQLYLEGTRNLLAWLASVPPRKFVYTSSTSVYGQTDGSWVDESSPTEPAAETARVLLETEEALLEAARRQHFPAVVLRLAGLYGPGRGYWLRQFLQGEARLEGHGERILNMLHRDDAVGAISAALELGQPGEVFNAVDNEPVSQLELFQWLAARLNRPLPPSAPADVQALRKRGLTNKRIANRKLKQELNYRFKYPTFREGLATELAAIQSATNR